MAYVQIHEMLSVGYFVVFIANLIPGNHLSNLGIFEKDTIRGMLMVVGTTNIDYEVLKKFIGRPQDLILYVENMVPSWARHINGITYNQRFYVAIHLRKVLTLPYKAKMELVNALIEGGTITGIINGFTPIMDIVDLCDKHSLAKMLKKRIAENEIEHRLS